MSTPSLNTAIGHFSQDANLRPVVCSLEYDELPMWARIPKDDATDSFFSKTIATESTVPHCLMLKRKLPSTVGAMDSTMRGPNKPDMITLLATSTAVCSHPSAVHGGVTAAILDEVMSHTLISHFATDPIGVDSIRRRIFTLKLEVEYRKPVLTPGTVIVRSWIVRSEGRKYWIAAEATQHEAQEGWIAAAASQYEVQEKPSTVKEVVKARASGMWLVTKEKL